jgi:hypothetical protein
MKQKSHNNRIAAVRKSLLLTTLLAVSLIAPSSTAQAQAPRTPYPAMAPLDQYLMGDRNAEIALARSAAPPSIATDAEVMVLTPHGYETAAKGNNGFVCLVERAWTSAIDDPGFWNPKLRGPLCLNPAAVRTYLPLTLKKTDLALSGKSNTQIAAGLKAAFDKKELPSLEIGAMSYMLSRQGYLGDENGHWHPHIMFFIPEVEAKTWGANLPDARIFALESATDRMTTFFVPVAQWSDGTDDSPHTH